MKIDKNDILTLSDNIKYLVVSKILYESETYLYLVDILNIDNKKIVKNINEDILIIRDEKILDKTLREIVTDLK